MPDELGQYEDDKRRGKQDEPGRHHRSCDQTGEDDDPDRELCDTREPDEDRIAYAETVQHVQEGPVREQGLRESRIEQLFGEGAVRDPEAHRDSQQVERSRGRFAVRQRQMRLEASVQRDGSGTGDEEKNCDAEDVDLLEDALDAERKHRDRAKEREEEGGITCKEPTEQKEAADRLRDEEARAGSVSVV